MDDIPAPIQASPRGIPAKARQHVERSIERLHREYAAAGLIDLKGGRAPAMEGTFTCEGHTCNFEELYEPPTGLRPAKNGIGLVGPRE